MDVEDERVGMRKWMRRSTYEQEEVVEDGLDIIIEDGMKREVGEDEREDVKMVEEDMYAQG